MTVRMIILILFLNPALLIYAQSRPGPEIDDISRMKNPPKLFKITGVADEAIGVMDKGQLQNLTMNYGMITDTRY